jgi:trk system potassium uptake protein
MRLAVVIGTIGALVRLFSPAFLGPLLVALIDRSWWSALVYLAAAAITWALGTAASWRREPTKMLYRPEAMAVVAGTWLAVCAFSALPFMMVGLRPVDAVFESMSGLTTTGATILADFSPYDRAFYFWRSLIQWIGGVGVIALFVVVLPRIGIAGRQLFFAESSSAPSEGVSPQIRQAASRLWVLYIALTAICTLALVLCGMSFFDGLLHAFTALAAGGFSPHPLSILGYANPAVEWVLIAFMFIGGASFPLLLKALLTGPQALFRDSEFLLYTAITVACSLGIAVLLAGPLPDGLSLRTGFFQVVSIISTTGFASVDFQLWDDPLKAVLLIPMVVGGCAGSAGGGAKVVRHLLIARHMGRELLQVLHPQAVLPLRYKGLAVAEPVMRAVVAMVTIYIGIAFGGGVLLVLLGSDPITAFSASLACLGNIGPGFNVVGPMGSFAPLSDLSKLVLTAEMWIGRLEVMTVVALLHPDVWRDTRLR